MSYFIAAGLDSTGSRFRPRPDAATSDRPRSATATSDASKAGQAVDEASKSPDLPIEL
jgi:hypothetical protein